MFPRVPSGPIPRLVSLSTAVPSFDVSQIEVSERAVEAFAATPNAAAWLAPIYRNAEIDTRHACMTPDWYIGDHGFGERNDLFLKHATELLTQAAQRALDAAKLAPGDIDAIVTICSTGIATPALDARLMEKLAFRRD